MPERTNERRPYTKPGITRVDVIEDEIALATCKTPTPQTTARGTVNGGCRAKNCNQDAAS